jgi:hypothetical protein
MHQCMLLLVLLCAVVARMRDSVSSSDIAAARIGRCECSQRCCMCIMCQPRLVPVLFNKEANRG